MNEYVVHRFETKEGLPLWVRPLRPQDAPQLVHLFEHMGPESRYLRFNVPLNNPDPQLVWQEAHRLAQVNAGDGAWLVFADLPEKGPVPVAGARFVRLASDPATAEASLAVRDDMQNRGIGTGLLRFLLEQARAAGIQRLQATVQRTNRPLWHLLRRAGLPLESQASGGTSTISVDLTAAEQAE
ncbi:MAG: GNAT family N-acetyltransferase [Candidatus Promineifilaceae bacterium]|nr:GNAT family N-acetyltransferase [Candidatus Promineifilaceae bacterium]